MPKKTARAIQLRQAVQLATDQRLAMAIKDFPAGAETK